MPDLDYNGHKLSNITNLNIIVGRNGSGKSRFFREFSNLRNDPAYFITYISPERASTFEIDAHVESNQRQNKDYLESGRIKNQAESFKKGSAVKLRELSMRFAYRLDKDSTLRLQVDKTFESEKLSKINGMLSNITIERDTSNEFKFVNTLGEVIPPSAISSGESEIVSLGTEILYFFDSCTPNKTNVLFIDEPDVHLHPDLQARLARFIISELNDLDEDLRKQTYVCIATHSTPLISELALSALSSIGTKYTDSNRVEQFPVSEKFNNLAPFFGHPLSKYVNKEIPFIIEGEDDERVWQFAYRASNGKLKIFPCLSNSVDHQLALENSCEKILSSIYDDPEAISLRDADGDLSRTDLPPIGCILRFKLRCYAIENLLVTDDVLKVQNMNWDTFVTAGNAWIQNNPKHDYVDDIRKLLSSKDRGRDRKIKNTRNIIPLILDSKKTWELIVGQSIGRLSCSSNLPPTEHSIVEYVGLPLLLKLGLLTS
jgi:AAA ATPase domain